LTETTETEIAAVSTAPRVTPADIEANIASEHCFTAHAGVVGQYVMQGEGQEQMEMKRGPLHLLTICVLVLRNGFTVTGESACASPENFNAEIGRKIARENAIAKVWPLMGYALKEKLHQGGATQHGSHASAVLYPAIGDAMKLMDAHTHPGFNFAVDRAYNVLHAAFWSECPCPASAHQLRPVAAEA
jgi:hypothetical protein